jgi:hypothetical protein
MDINILDFNVLVCKTKIGIAIIRYGDLLLRCELVYNTKYKKVWLRMPEIWLNNKFKLKYCHWPNQQISDKFQEKAIGQIYKNYSLNLEKIIELHEKFLNFKKKKLDNN